MLDKTTLHKRKLIMYIYIFLVALIWVSVPSHRVDATTIQNPGFEKGWQGWRTDESASEDVAISEVASNGARSAKITGVRGRFGQCVSVRPQTDYDLSALIRGHGRIGVVIGGKKLAIESPGMENRWIPVALSFNSEIESQILIFGTLANGEARFDDFALSVSYREPAVVKSAEQGTKESVEDDSWEQDWRCQPFVVSPAPREPPHPKVKGRMSAFGLRTDVPPSQNFDLSDWKLTLPVDRDQDGRADEVSEAELADGWSDPRFFYTDPVSGGLIFRVPQGRTTTTLRSGYARTELREMLRAGDESVDTRSQDGKPNKNNWVLPSAPESAKAEAGGVGGALHATLAVNQVTRVGSYGQVGRVIIGQIHARDHEVVRLYYRKLPMNSLGSIYYAHDVGDQDEIFVDILGDRGDFIPNPKEGIALDEVFTYEIRLESSANGQGQEPHSLLHVDIILGNGARWKAQPLDLSKSIYVEEKEFLYFKAGAYSQNDGVSQQDHDGDQVTFYKLENTHGPHD